MLKVGHTKGYIQVLVIAPDYMLGTSAMVKITSVGRWSVFGEVIEMVNHVSDDKVVNKQDPNQDMQEPESCACGNDIDSCCGQSNLDKNDQSRGPAEPQSQNSRNFIGWILRKRKHLHKGVESELASGSVQNQEGSMKKLDFVDKALLSGISISIFMIIAIVAALTFRVIWSQ